MQCHIRSMYLCVRDMERAIGFYETFFEQKATETDDIYSVFDINGFRLGLFAYERRNETHVFGSNCLPSIEVESLELLKNKIKALDICFPLTKIGRYWVAEFIDSEGNHIEITTQNKAGTVDVRDCF